MSLIDQISVHGGQGVFCNQRCQRHQGEALAAEESLQTLVSGLGKMKQSVGLFSNSSQAGCTVSLLQQCLTHTRAGKSVQQLVCSGHSHRGGVRDVSFEVCDVEHFPWAVNDAKIRGRCLELERKLSSNGSEVRQVWLGKGICNG